MKRCALWGSNPRPTDNGSGTRKAKLATSNHASKIQVWTARHPTVCHLTVPI